MSAYKLYFMPGFLGQPHDFDKLQRCLKKGERLAIDCRLPTDRPLFIGSQTLCWPDPEVATEIGAYAEECWQVVSPQLCPEFYLYAYSMGGRIVLHWMTNPDFKARCKGVFFASCHTGLCCPSDRKARVDWDQQWAEVFLCLDWAEALNRWYRQDVFSSLGDSLRLQLIDDRQCLSPPKMAQQLKVASLGNQQVLASHLDELNRIAYIVGDKDEKFLSLGKALKLTSRLNIIAGAGHIAHLEQPELLAETLLKTLKDWRDLDD